MSEPPVLDGAIHILLGPALAGAGPSADGLAQSFQQSFQLRHALAQLADLMRHALAQFAHFARKSLICAPSRASVPLKLVRITPASATPTATIAIISPLMFSFVRLILSRPLIPGRYPSVSANPARFTGGYGIVRGMAREMAWVQLFCRGSGCGTMFYICGSCYRGQVYCGERCRRRMRRNQMRRANRKHQDSPEGKLDHRDRQRVYRAKCRLRRVTDHTSARRLRSVNIKKPWIKPRRRPRFGEAFQPRRRLKRSQAAIRAVCIVCGRMRR